MVRQADYLEYTAANVLSHVLPRTLAYRVGCAVADRFYRLDAKGRTAVENNLRIIRAHAGLPVTPEVVAPLARETFRQFGRYIVDFFRYTRLTPRRIRRLLTIEGLEHVDAAMRLGRGVVMVTAHLGNWEIGGAALAALGYPVNAVFLPEGDKKTNALFQRCRRKRGMRVMPLGDAARGSIRALRRGEIVALLADRDYSAHHRLTPLFGRSVRLPSGPARLSCKTGAPIIPGFLLRLSDDQFRMRIHAPITPQGPDCVNRVQDAIRGILEQAISGNPCQWFMFNDFWNHAGGTP